MGEVDIMSTPSVEIKMVTGDLLERQFIDLGMSYGSEIDDALVDTNRTFLNSILSKREETNRWLVLLTIDEEPIGFLHAKVDTSDRIGWGYILEFYIIPTRRKSGWGKVLLDWLISTFRSQNIEDVWLAVFPSGEAFWKATGFKWNGEFIGEQKVFTMHLDSH
jgi:GNAT superfamily N-acetyltransferase